jgi:hypothetical protein
MNRLVAGALCATTIACGSPAPTSSSPPPPATSFALTGRVSDVTTSSPLAGADVRVIDGKNNSRFAVSDATGAFRIADLAMGGFTVRVRRDGYDSAYLGINLFRDTSADVPLAPVMTTLAGTWGGDVLFTFVLPGGSTNGESNVPQATLMQSGNVVSSNMFASGSFQINFTGSLQDPSAIGSTTAISGTIMFLQDLSGRNPVTCRGTTTFTGTINWTTLSMTTAPLLVDCGTMYSKVVLSFRKEQ